MNTGLKDGRASLLKVKIRAQRLGNRARGLGSGVSWFRGAGVVIYSLYSFWSWKVGDLGEDQAQHENFPLVTPRPRTIDCRP